MGTIVIDEQYDNCRKALKGSISHKRYIHSIGVSDTAACLAMRYGYDVKKAHLAGLLHDCAKGLSEGDLLTAAFMTGLEVSQMERDNPELLHAKAGATIAKQKYKIEDKEILDAICYHTTGRPDMSLLEKIVFVADYIEPNRTGIPSLDRIRAMAFTDIDIATAYVCRNCIDYLQRASKQIDRITIDTFKYYKENSNYEE